MQEPSTLRQVFASAGRTLAIVMGSSGLGLLGGLAFGAREASRAPSQDQLLIIFGWIITLGLFGAAGFVIGLGFGLMIMVLIWIVRLAKRIVRSWGKERIELL